jgi:two-component system phosphate regulon response regulator PhoB
MTSYRILLLEDDPSLGETIVDRLQKNSHQMTWVKNLAEARTKLSDHSENHYDLLLLDLGLPDGSGFEIAQEQQGRFPVIILTALNSAEYRLKGYELGAQEYIPKPFHLKELLIRIERTMASFSKESNNYHFEDFVINADAQTIESAGQLFYPSARDFSVLLYLIKNHPHVISREQLLNECWGQDSFPTNRTVDNTILRIRQFLGKNATAYLKSVRGVGYQWIKELP